MEIAYPHPVHLANQVGAASAAPPKRWLRCVAPSLSWSAFSLATQSLPQLAAHLVSKRISPRRAPERLRTVHCTSAPLWPRRATAMSSERVPVLQPLTEQLLAGQALVLRGCRLRPCAGALRPPAGLGSAVVLRFQFRAVAFLGLGFDLVTKLVVMLGLGQLGLLRRRLHLADLLAQMSSASFDLVSRASFSCTWFRRSCCSTSSSARASSASCCRIASRAACMAAWFSSASWARRGADQSVRELEVCAALGTGDKRGLTQRLLGLAAGGCGLGMSCFSLSCRSDLRCFFQGAKHSRLTAGTNTEPAHTPVPSQPPQ